MTRRSFIATLTALFYAPHIQSTRRSGSLGRLGEWFGNFGSDMAATLHGVEAVVTSQQARAFRIAKNQ